METPAGTYDFTAFEQRWQAHWKEHGTFRALPPSCGKPKYYVLDMFPYPSGAGLHIGHPEGYTASDILARHRKATGHNVLHPMGWDSFGLPAEQHAIATGEHPAVQTRRNIDNFRRQLQMLGFAIDWDRELATTDEGYFRWTQWIFLKLFRHGLAYVSEKPVWFCPNLGTVLANEEVLNTPEGPRSERGNHPVERRPIRQWVLRITAYADKLIDGLDALDWPDSTKRLQRNWIGKSEGGEVTFALDGHPGKSLTVFTTRPDTLFGATYMVIAPEHPLVEAITTKAQGEAVADYVMGVRNKSDLERTDLAKDKTGVFTGAHAVNPVNGAKIPVWVADYVLMGYGTGAIMAVPAHDERDHEFARRFGLPIRQVVGSKDAPVDVQAKAWTGDGPMVNSGPYDGLSAGETKRRILDDLAAKGAGKAAVNYKLRDWLFSRQRYWGEPFPLVWVSPEDLARVPADSALREFLPKQPVTCRLDGREVAAVPLTSAQLPLTLPEVKSYQPSPTGDSPLSREPEWLNVWINLSSGETVPASQPQPGPLWARATRETNTMPQWAGSCWYYLRYLDPANAKEIASKEALDYWGCPDFYIGGAEHAVLHLLYARFWHRFLHDLGVLPTPEPFRKLFHQGLILGEDGEKMSKSRGNVVNPDDIVKAHGTDALRLYLMFLGPLEASKPWSAKGIEGVSRFLRRTWRLAIDEATGKPSARCAGQDEPEEVTRELHRTIQKVSADIETLSFNTSISQMMIFLNAAEKAPSIRRATLEDFLRLLAPFAPHLAEEAWSRLGHTGSISDAGWPKADLSKLVESTVEVIFQVNGKVRSTAKVAKETSKEQLLALAKADPAVAKFLEGKAIAKEIVVPGKLVNLVVPG
ncbi:MAG: leucine--tRNA ligase [Opitutia bacterium]